MKLLKSCLLLLLMATPTATFVYGQTAAEKEGESKILTTPDGWPIHINYYASSAGKESPVVILFPGVEGHENSMTRKVWSGAATALNSKGFAVVTADLRKHGESVISTGETLDERQLKLGPNDYSLMASSDLETIKTFLLQEHEAGNLNIRKLGIATAGSGGLVAAGFAVNDWAKKPWPDAPTLALSTPKGQDVRALFLLSPKSTVRGLNSTALMKGLADPTKGIAVHLWFNPEIRDERSSAEKLFRFLELKDPALAEARKLNEGPPDKDGKFSAEGLLQDKAKPIMEKHIVEFFEKHLKELDSPWRSRISRLQQ
ncbi:MAG: hypothetical protein R3C49_27545 [Planctomycetaceae bacterium]